MSEAIIKVENVGKCYRLHHEKQERYTTLRDVIARKAKNLFKPRASNPKIQAADEDFWALKDLNFEIKQGEVVGIIGRNGAGKSTLLKILSRITEPTKGRITLRGRVASLLEVGTGFHPELTGRENIFLNGAILGMRKEEIRAKFDEIVAFAEVERFLDTPVKRYSSGMYVRLAFAVAAHLEPEILVVDEVLAVGDAEFQKKCLGKMSEVASGGRTVLFVSHQMQAVERLCARVLMLDKGILRLDTTDVRAGLDIYLLPTGGEVTSYWKAESSVIGNPWFHAVELRTCDASGRTLDGPSQSSVPVFVEIVGEISELDPSLTIGYAIYKEDGTLLYWSYHTDSSVEMWPKLRIGRNILKSQIPPRFLNEGRYRLQLIGGLHFRQWLFNPDQSPPTIEIEINGGLSDSPLWMIKRPGILAPVITWESF